MGTRDWAEELEYAKTGKRPRGAIDWNAELQKAKADEEKIRKQREKEQAQQRVQMRKAIQAQRDAARKAALEANKAKTLQLLQEGQKPKEKHPTGGPLKLTAEDMKRLGLTNENGFAYGGTTLGLSEEEIQKLVKPGTARLYETPAQATEQTTEPAGRRDYLGYLAGEFGAGVISSPAGILAGAQTALGDLMTGGDVSRGMMVLTQYFAENPQMKERWMRNEFGVGEMIKQQTGATDAQMEAYRTANTAGWIRSSLQQDRGAGIGQGFKDTAGNIAFTLGQQAPGLAYSALTPAAAGGSGIIGAAMDAAKTGGSVAKAAGGATLDALKGNIATWMIGASSAGNQLTELAQERGYDPKNYMNALGTGFAEYFTEGLFGITDAQSVGRIWTNTGSRGANVLRALGNWIGSGAEEGLEEIVNVPMSGIVEKMTTDKNKKLVGEDAIFDLRAMIDAGIDGAVVGLLMGGVGAVSAIRVGVQEGGDIRAAAEATNRVIDTLPEQYRPERIAPQSATEQTLEAKQAEVLQALQEIEQTEGGNAGFAQGETTPVQSNAQQVDITQEESEKFTQAENKNAQTAPREAEQAVQNREGALNYEQGQVLSGDRSQWGYTAADAGSAGAVERDGAANAARRSQSAVAAERTARATQAGLTTISARELGLATGTESRRNVLLDDESLWDDELKQIRRHWDEMNQTRREKYGATKDLQLNFVLGKIQVEDADGNMTLVDGVVTDSGEVCIQVNGTQRSATELAEHEEYHMLEAEAPGMTRAVWEAVQGEGLNDAMVERYRRFYTQTLGYSEEMVREEILADAYAGMERIQGTNMKSVRDLVRQFTEEAREAIDQGWYDPYAEEAYESVDREGRETRGPPRYSKTLGGNADIRIEMLDEVGRYGIRSMNDFVGVQKAVYKKLKEEGFFDPETNRRTVVNADTGITVEIGRRGIEETFGPGNRFERLPSELKRMKLATVRSLPEIIRYGEVIKADEENTHNANSDLRYTYIEHPIQIDGKTVYAVVDIRRSRQKNAFWVHHIHLNAKSGQALAARTDEAGLALNEDLTTASNVPQGTPVVNGRFSVSGEIDSEGNGYAPTFYSYMERVIENTKQEKMGTASVVSMLKGKGVKNEEIKWSGIEAFLEGKKSVTKQELLEFMRGNQLQIEEVTLGEPSYTQKEQDMLNQANEDYENTAEMIDGMWEELFGEGIPVEVWASDVPERKLEHEAREKIQEYLRNNFEALGDAEFYNRFIEKRDRLMNLIASLKNVEDIRDAIADEAKERDGAQWSDYATPGGARYREYLFKMPGSEYTNLAMEGHWKRGGVLAHARVQDFDHEDGTVLFIEEIQSDWHNAGQKHGYRLEGQKDAGTIRKESEEAYNEFYGTVEKFVFENSDWMDDDATFYAHPAVVAEMFEGDESQFDKLKFDENQRKTIRKMVAEEKARSELLKTAPKAGSAPDAPYAKTYHEFVLKNLLRKAAEGGYAYLAWTPGWMQEERWSSEFAEGYRIEYDQDIPKFLNKYGKQWGASVEDIELDGMRNMSVHAIPITESMKRSVLYEGQPRYSVSDTQETEPKRRDLTPGQELTRKEHGIIKRALNSSRMQLRDIIPAGTREARETQQTQILDLARKLWETGEITQEDIDEAFEEIWAKGATVDRELADQYAELRADLRNGVTVSAELKRDITDYELFRRANFGTLTMRTGETSDVDVRYRDWARAYPNFFPESITEPSDQLERMAEIAKQLKPTVKTMEELHKNDWQTKAGLKSDFVDLVRAMELEILHPVQELTQKTARQEEKERAENYRKVYKEVIDEIFKIRQRESNEPDPAYWHEVADDAWRRMNERAAAIQTEWLRSLTKEGFKGTESLDELGVKIAGSVADYHLINQILENHRAAQDVRRDIRKAEKRLKATAKEKQFAAGIASGTFNETDIGGDARVQIVLELADYYMMERTVGLDLINTRRDDMYAEVDYQVENLMRDKEAYKISSSPVLFYRTPQRNMINLYGREQGQKVYDFLFAPVAENEAERMRWVNRMYDEVRLVEGENGKKKPLNRKERALVQMVMEGRAAAEVAAAMEERQVIYDAAENLRNGQDIEDVVRVFNLNEEMRNATTDYARWLDTNDILQTTKGVDLKRIENAVKLYADQYNRFYKAINDFLAAHGYEPIGFIKGYAPHIQPEKNRNLLQSTLKMMGLSEEVATLPASIAGQTHTYRPNKRWNPYFMSRHGDQTDYDVAAGYESYVDYLGDILYHTDDTVRIRRAANYFRRTYAPDEISNNLSWAEGLRNASPEQKAEMLREAGRLEYTAAPSAATTNELFEKYVSELYDNIKDQGKYSNFVNWLEDYANQLTGKQSLADRGMEVLTGRQSLNFANKLNRAFQRANVAGNLSTALNQTAQLPMIVADIGSVNTLLALKDYAVGRVRRDGFREKSDFLTARKGVNNLVVDPADRVINIMFTPAQVADDMMSAIAARGAYIKAVRQGMNDADAMKYADKKAEQIMGSRAKGSAPQAFRSKNPMVRMVNMFQIEALNAFEYVEQDVIIQGIKDIKQIDDSKGRAKAAAALIGLLGKMLVAAFLWNRVTEELYGGSPAQFDLLGYAANFLASGNGLTANQQLLDWIDMAWERAFGEPLFDIDTDYNEEFDWANATGDLGYAISSDIPLVRNIAGLLGVGDQSLPMPDLSTVYDAGRSLLSNGASPETLDAALTAAGQFLPGGRQINKTYQGARTMAKGGRYYGYGDNERLQYPVEDTTSNWIKALLFGPSGLSENTAFYAAGGDDGLSAGNTRKYQELMQVGMSTEMAMEVYEEYRRINRLETMTASEKATEFANTLYEMGVPEDQAALAREAFQFWSMVPGKATKYDGFVEEGLDPDVAYELTEAIGELEPEDGKTNVSNLQKYQTVIEMTDEESVRYAALAGLMPDKELARLRAAYGYIQSGTYIEFLKAWQESYPGESKSQERVENVLRNMKLSGEEKAALWQMANAGWKPDNNPYNKAVGREVAELIARYYDEIDGKEE